MAANHRTKRLARLVNCPTQHFSIHCTRVWLYFPVVRFNWALIELYKQGILMISIYKSATGGYFRMHLDFFICPNHEVCCWQPSRSNKVSSSLDSFPQLITSLWRQQSRGNWKLYLCSADNRVSICLLNTFCACFNVNNIYKWM